MKYTRMEAKDITSKQIFTREDFLGSAVELIVGDIDDFKNKSSVAITDSDIDTILQYGFTVKNGDVITTYNWKMNDLVMHKGEQYMITYTSIHHNQFIVEIFNQSTWIGINNSFDDFEDGLENGTYVIKNSILTPTLSLQSGKCSEHRSDCNVVESSMLSGEKFKYCRTHKLEVK